MLKQTTMWARKMASSLPDEVSESLVPFQLSGPKFLRRHWLGFAAEFVGPRWPEKVGTALGEVAEDEPEQLSI